MSGLKRGPSAYFIFGGEHRDAIKEELLAGKRKEVGDGAKVSVAEVAKEIGRRWKELSDEERQRYKDLSAEKAKELAKGTEDNVNAATEEGQEKQPGQAILPLSMVKKLACMDEEVKRVSGDAVRIIAEATGMFLGVLASKSLSHAISQKLNNFKFAEIEHISRKDKRMKDMGLHLSFESEEPFVHLGSSGNGSTRQKRRVDDKVAQEKASVGIGKFFGVKG